LNETKATRYQRLRRRARAAGWASGGLMLAIVALTPVSSWLASSAMGFARGLHGASLAIVSLVTYTICLVALREVAALPAVLYLSRRVDGKYGPAASIEEVVIAQLQAALIVVPAVVGAGLIWLIATWIAGAWWWAAAGVLLAAALVGAVWIGPQVLALVADTQPLSSPDLVARLSSLAVRSGVTLSGIDEWRVGDRTAVTALVTGIGRARRVVVSHDLVRTWPEDEIVVVVAHELAHHRYRDLWRTLALDAVLLTIALAVADGGARWLAAPLRLAGPQDLASLPLVALIGGAVWAAATPIRHAQSRAHERRADVFALAMTGGADAFSAAVRRLAARHLAEERPTSLTRWLFHRHPTVAERLELAEAYRRVKSVA
jgi:STE24 endopeptidase